MKYKFRGYAYSRKGWVKGFYYELNNKPYIIEQGKGIERMISVVPESVSQWTGFSISPNRDWRNGEVDLYSGDSIDIYYTSDFTDDNANKRLVATVQIRPDFFNKCESVICTYGRFKDIERECSILDLSEYCDNDETIPLFIFIEQMQIFDNFHWTWEPIELKLEWKGR